MPDAPRLSQGAQDVDTPTQWPSSSTTAATTPGPRRRYFAGIEWPIGKTPILDTYYARTNDSRSSVAHVNAFGLAFNLFF